MNTLIIALLILGLIGLGFARLPMLVWAAIWVAAVWFLIRVGVSTYVPVSLLKLYLWTASVGVLVYILADADRFSAVSQQLFAFLTQPRFNVPLFSTVLLLPTLLAWKIYTDVNADVAAPSFGRTVHPPPPNDIDFKGKKIDLIHTRNPFRELETKDPAKFREHVQAGKALYYQNCFLCHGDDMNGDGMFAHGFNPLPASFRSPETIPMLQEGYLFWRISKGGPGLPEEAAPWSSSMPAWEKFLSEDDIWNVILFLYDYTGSRPRAEEEH